MQIRVFACSCHFHSSHIRIHSCMSERPKIIIGLVGEMAAGKTTVTNYLKEKHGAVSFRFSDMLRDVLKRLHIEETRGNLQMISTLLRQNFGEDLMSKVLAKDAESSPHPLIITEGIRRPTDVTYLKQLPGFHIIAINTNERTRYNRVIERSENPDDKSKTWEQFQKEGEQEAEQKIKEIAAESEYAIDNSGTTEELFAQVEEILIQIRKLCK